METLMTESAMLKDEYERLVRVETQVGVIGTIAKLMWSLVIVFVIQLGTFIYAWAQLNEKVANLDVSELSRNMVTALGVLKDHGTEFANVRDEQLRLRTASDDVVKRMDILRSEIDDKTRERFFKSDGDRHEKRMERIEHRIERIENHVFRITEDE